MDRDDSQIFHTIVITGLKDSSKSEEAALALSRIIKNMTPEKILQRLGSLPWTLTRKEITPPLTASVTADIPETQIPRDRPAIQETPGPEAPQSQPPPPPIERGGKIAQPAVWAPNQAAPPLPAPPEDAGLSIEPLSLGAILDRTFQICRVHFWKLLAVIGVWWGVATLAGIGMIIVGAVAGLTLQSFENVSLWMLIPLAAVLIPVALVFFIALFFLCEGALIHAVSCIYLGREVRVRESYSFALGRLRKLLFTTVLMILFMIALCVVALIVGAFVYYVFRYITSSTLWGVLLAIPFWLALASIPMYAFIKLMLVDKVIIIEDRGYVDAIDRSWRLLSGKAEGAWPRGYFMRGLILLHLFILINMAISLVFEIPGLLLMATQLPQAVSEVLKHVLSNVGGVVASLFGSVSGVVFYYDVRNRKEGFDLQMLAERTPVVG